MYIMHNTRYFGLVSAKNEHGCNDWQLASVRSLHKARCIVHNNTKCNNWQLVSVRVLHL
mgnify:CR=1 FL=1